MNETDNSEIAFKVWMHFILYTLLIAVIFVCIGFSVGTKHPKPSVKDEWLSSIREEVYKLDSTYHSTLDEYAIQIELKDSIISTLKRELTKGKDIELPIVVNLIVEE